MPDTKPLVGVSQCLLGDAVRYDGQSKANLVVLKHLSQVFELIPICPEVEAGFGIPRPPVQLTNDIENPRLTGRDDISIDITDMMNNYCQTKPKELKQLDGFIFKSRSPSCGLNSTPVFINNQCATENSRGIFARAMVDRFPNLPIIEDSTFTKKSINHFIKQVLEYAANH
jgi:uncharacterized protein YbbK (DUF523 family)